MDVLRSFLEWYVFWFGELTLLAVAILQTYATIRGSARVSGLVINHFPCWIGWPLAAVIWCVFLLASFLLAAIIGEYFGPLA